MTDRNAHHDPIPSRTGREPRTAAAARARARQFLASLSPEERDQSDAAANAWLKLNGGRGERLQDLVGTAPALDDARLTHTTWRPFSQPLRDHTSETPATDGSAS